MKKVFLENLPRWDKNKKGNEGTINWRLSIGYCVKFQYNDIEGEVEIVDYKDGYLYIKYQDNDIFKINGGHFFNCKLGSLLSKKITEEEETHWMIQYFLNGYDQAKLYTKYSNIKLYFKCPDCERVANKKLSICNLYKNHSIGCSCGDSISYPNKFSYALLEQLNKIYSFNYMEHEYSPDWIKPRKFDNYFEYSGNKYILEMDGELGHGNKSHSKSKMTVEETLEIDNYKDNLAKKNNIKIIRIDCIESDLEYIKNNILDSDLVKIFDLSKVNWLEIESFALSNLVKQACEYKKNNQDMTTTEIGKIMGFDRHTIRNYLVKGSKLGWCNYFSTKQVEIFKDGISLGIFTSVKSLSEQFEQLFNIKLSPKNISQVCTGEKKTHKGFTFKYITQSQGQQPISNPQ